MKSTSPPSRPEGIVPFYEANVAPDRKRILLLSFYFPPSQAAGALRWQRLAAYFAERGFALDVVTRPPEAVLQRDAHSLEELPAGTRVYGTLPLMEKSPKLSPRTQEVLGRLRGAIARKGRRPSASTDHSTVTHPGSEFRDEVGWKLHTPGGVRRALGAWSAFRRERRWAQRAADIGFGLMQERGYEAVVSCGPPHMIHESSRRLATGAGVPLVVDMRDPWSLQQRLPAAQASRLWYALAAPYERRVIGDASLIVCNTDPAREALVRSYPHAADRTVTVMNGFDERSIEDRSEVAAFTITYAGTLYLDRDPRPLLRAAGRVVSDLRLGPDEFRLVFVGNVEEFGGLSLERMAEEAGVGAHLQRHSYRPRHEVFGLLAESSLLVSLPQDSTLAIPSKIFEYMQFPAWILALADESSATGRLLRGTRADLVSADDLDGIEAVLRKRYQEFRRAGRPAPMARAHPEFRRRHQAEGLLEAFERLCREPAGRSATARVRGAAASR